jgi:hypothetical protein
MMSVNYHYVTIPELQKGISMANAPESENQDNKKWAGPFFTIWTGQAISLLGSQMVQFALIWWLT